LVAIPILAPVQRVLTSTSTAGQFGRRRGTCRGIGSSYWFCSWVGCARSSTGDSISSRSSETRRLSSGASVATWVSNWVESEVSRHPVVLFADVMDVESQAARHALDKARIRFHLVDISSMDQLSLPDTSGGSGASWAALILDHLTSISDGKGLPILFVGGELVGGHDDILRGSVSDELLDLFAKAGAERREPRAPASRLPWTARENMRWLPPKDLNGRRWYQDEPNSAKFPDEHEDPVRIEYNIDSVSPGAGTEHRGRFSGSAKALLRYDTNLDEPDRNGVKQPYPPFCDVNLVLQPDLGYANYLRSRDLDRALNVTPADVAREGLPKDQLVWVYSQGKKKLVEELALRQCRNKILSTLDVQGLREALMDEMRKEQAFSPTQLGVVPGIVQSLSGPEFRKERYADTDVPLLLAILSERNPACVHLRDRLQTAAKRALRGIRIVRVDGRRYPEVAREFGIARYPTLVWLEARSGIEMAREAGVLSSAAIIDRTSALLHHKALPEPKEKVAALPRDRSRWRTSGYVLVEDSLASKSSSRRWLRNSAS